MEFQRERFLNEQHCLLWDEFSAHSLTVEQATYNCSILVRFKVSAPIEGSMKTNRFYIEIRWRDNHKLISSESGFATQQQADSIAAARIKVIENNGWAQYVLCRRDARNKGNIMFNRNLKHDNLFFTENVKALELGEKLYDAWNRQNGTDFLNAFDEIESLYDEKEFSPQLKASAVAYALYLVNEVSRQR